MKKILFGIGVCFLLLFMSTATSTSMNNYITINQDDAPTWAKGNFTGSWGLNIWGEDWFSLGNIEGYYGIGFLFNDELKIGRFLIEYKENGEENGTNLEGIFFGSFLLGRATDMETGNQSVFVGIGNYNETNFRWRIMGQTGPVLYMKGTFAKFD
jgi:hypothetical protein